MPLEVTDSYIKFDRAWVLPSVRDVEIRKIPYKPIHTRIPFQVLTCLLASSAF
jgi:hypothetical protein